MESFEGALRHYVVAQEGKPLRAADLLAAFDVSERHLRRVFAAVFGMSPAKFLRHRRLVMARRRLEAGGARQVTEVGMQYDFFDLGRFAGQYRRLFNELPSETLRKAGPRPGPYG